MTKGCHSLHAFVTDPKWGPQTLGQRLNVLHQNGDEAFIIGWHDYYSFCACTHNFISLHYKMDPNLLYQNFLNI